MLTWAILDISENHFFFREFGSSVSYLSFSSVWRVSCVKCQVSHVTKTDNHIQINIHDSCDALKNTFNFWTNYAILMFFEIKNLEKITEIFNFMM